MLDVIFLFTFAPKNEINIMLKSNRIGSERVLQERSESAFNAMILRNKSLLWHICSDYSLGMVWKTEDCMQEVVSMLWRDYGQFEGRSSERTWVYRVATNTMLMLRRKYMRSPLTEPIGENRDIEDVAVESNDDRYQQLLQLIDALPERDGRVIRANLDGFSYQEIADMSGTTVGAVAMRIARVKKRLKRMYEKEQSIALK